MHDLHLIIMGVLMLSGVAAGIVDTLAGGGGLIVLPVYLLVGIPPVPAMGCVKLQACFGELTAMLEFRRKGHIKLRKLVLGFLFVAIGASVGTILLQHTNPDVLKKLLPILLAIMLIYTIFSPRVASEDIKPRMSAALYYTVWGLVIGFYNGYFGPGTGSFWLVAFMFFLGFNIQKASIHAKPMNLTGNIVALIWFMFAGQIWYWAGLSTAVGQVIGSKIGAHLVLNKGHKLIKPVFIVAVSAMIISLLIKHFS